MLEAAVWVSTSVLRQLLMIQANYPLLYFQCMSVMLVLKASSIIIVMIRTVSVH